MGNFFSTKKKLLNNLEIKNELGIPYRKIRLCL